MKSLSLNEFEAEVIPSADLVRMMARIADRVGEAVEAPAKPEGRVMRLIGKGLLIVGALYFTIHILAWWAKG